LDDTKPFTITVDPGTGLASGTLTSALDHISGVFGAFSFAGSASLSIANFLSFGDPARFWIVRADIAGPPIGGRTPTHINLCVHNSLGFVPISLVPPPHGGFPDFTYTISFSDGSFDAGTLTSFVMVPEPSLAVLLGLGVAAMLVLHRVFRRPA